MPLPLHVTPDRWMTQMFQSGPAASGGVVRRKLADIDRLVGRERFLKELDRRGFHAIENAGTVVIFCNQDPVRVLR